MVKVVRIGPNAVRIGITAPSDLKIVRDELAEHPIQARNEDLVDLGRKVSFTEYYAEQTGDRE